METTNNIHEKKDTPLSDYQIDKAAIFYAKHTDYVNKLIQQDVPAYPPTNRYDKLEPAVWKANHWKWYIHTFKLV
jgi:hypothetical protein